jgi:hypothetical protein
MGCRKGTYKHVTDGEHQEIPYTGRQVATSPSPQTATRYSMLPVRLLASSAWQAPQQSYMWELWPNTVFTEPRLVGRSAAGLPPLRGHLSHSHWGLRDSYKQLRDPPRERLANACCSELSSLSPSHISLQLICARWSMSDACWKHGHSGTGNSTNPRREPASRASDKAAT